MTDRMTFRTAFGDYVDQDLDAMRARLRAMRTAWGLRQDWTADPREGLRQIKRLERHIATMERAQ